MDMVYTITYLLIALDSWVNLFMFYILEALQSATETSRHLVAPDYEARLRYHDFGHLNVTEQFQGLLVLPAMVISYGYLANFSYDDE